MSRYGLWVPIPQRVGGTVKWGSRFGTAIRAVVIHRMEGSLEGSDSYLRREFADYSPYPRLSASTHFGVGLWNGVPQIRQWVDTANSAYGWAASPTDVPTPLARSVFSDLLYGISTWPYYRSRIDLNRPVISIEVEGFASQAWDSRTTAKVRELLAWIARTHGPLIVMAHTDCSTKPCPGMTTFKAALPGYYGSRLGTSTAPAPYRPMDGLLVQFRQEIRRLTLPAGVPVQHAPRLGATKHYTTAREQTHVSVGITLGESRGGKRGWRTWWSPKTSTDDTWDGRWVFVHETYVSKTEKIL